MHVSVHTHTHTHARTHKWTIWTCTDKSQSTSSDATDLIPKTIEKVETASSSGGGPEVGGHTHIDRETHIGCPRFKHSYCVHCICVTSTRTKHGFVELKICLTMGIKHGLVYLK